MDEFIKTLTMEIFIKQPMFWFIIIFAILSTIFYKKIIGAAGEFWIRIELRKLPKDKYIVLNNIMIKSVKGTHQIDHIVISKFGIFVIETKNYDGLITGNKNKDKWTQHLGKNKYYFNNPVHQNYGHIKALEEVLKLDENNFISIICFLNQSKLKVDAKNVVQLNSLNNLITSYKDEVLSRDINNIKNELELKNISNKDIKKKHIQEIRSNIKEIQEKEKHMICPKCSGNLVERNGKYGKFYGCSNYPKCKYTKKI